MGHQIGSLRHKIRHDEYEEGTIDGRLPSRDSIIRAIGERKHDPIGKRMTWVTNTDGASNKHGAGIGIVLENSSRVLIEEAVRLDEKMTNNEAKYEALLYGLELALRLGVQCLKINLD